MIYFRNDPAKNIQKGAGEPWSSDYERRVMSKGREFKSQHCILDGHFFAYLFVVCLKRQNKWKRGLGWPIFLKTSKKYICMCGQSLRKSVFKTLLSSSSLLYSTTTTTTTTAKTKTTTKTTTTTTTKMFILNDSVEILLNFERRNKKHFA